MNEEDLLISRVESKKILIEAGRVARCAKLHRDAFMMVHFAVRIGPIEVEHGRIAICDGPTLDALVLGRALAQTVECFFNGVVGNCGRLLTQ